MDTVLVSHQRIFNSSAGTSAAEPVRGLNASEVVGFWLFVALIEISSSYGLHGKRGIAGFEPCGTFLKVLQSFKGSLYLGIDSMESLSFVEELL